jgi:hypothetical protein
MQLSGSDLYLAGTCRISGVDTPGYWLNGTWVGLTSPSGSGNS